MPERLMWATVLVALVAYWVGDVSWPFWASLGVVFGACVVVTLGRLFRGPVKGRGRPA